MLLAVLAGVAGCSGGGSDNEEFQGTLVEARNNLDEALTQISEARTRDQFVARMEQASIVASRAAEDLGQVDVAEEFEDENTRLVGALEDLAGDLEGTAGQFEQTPELFNSEGLSFEGWTEANEILESLNKQGLDVEPLARR